MTESESDRKWPLAILAAVVFPALVLHCTCVAVLGPGTWGSGLVESLPRFEAPTPSVEAYRREFDALPQSPGSSRPGTALDVPPEVAGKVTWVHSGNDRMLYLTAESDGRDQRLYVSAAGRAIREIPLPDGHVVVQPQWSVEGIVHVGWKPWAIPPTAKLRRYVASWLDPTLRPEAALYGHAADASNWHYLMPGHSLSVSPNGGRAALLRSGALLAGYYSIHVWQVGSSEAPVVLSLREHADNANKSFHMQWSADSSALRIRGRTGGFDRRSSRRGADLQGISIDLLYLVGQMTVYDLNLGS